MDSYLYLTCICGYYQTNDTSLLISRWLLHISHTQGLKKQDYNFGTNRSPVLRNLIWMHSNIEIWLVTDVLPLRCVDTGAHCVTRCCVATWYTGSFFIHLLPVLVTRIMYFLWKLSLWSSVLCTSTKNYFWIRSWHLVKLWLKVSRSVLQMGIVRHAASCVSRKPFTL